MDGAGRGVARSADQSPPFTDSAMTPISRLLPVAALAASLLTAPVARSTTYYWKPGATLGDYGTLSNWSTESLTGADAAALPGSEDRI